MAFILDGKNILVVIGGGIAAYKTLDLIRRLRERGAKVRAILSKAGEQFVTPLTVASLTGDTVYTDLFSLTEASTMDHIALSRAADLVVVAPATADLMAKMAAGLATDLATTTLLATDKRILLAPAMNVRMWLHPATQRNLALLKKDGALLVGPDEGEMACGEFGPGRMAESLDIVAAIEAALATEAMLPLPGPGIASDNRLLSARPLAGKHAVVTAGPTHEPIDPVRFIANRSSGKQGYAVAAALAAFGARVTLISGPVALVPPPGVEVRRVETALQMLDAVEAALPAEIAVFAAAVADWRARHCESEKIKKTGPAPTKASLPFELVENPDILATIAQRKRHRPTLVVGFAAETEHVLRHAKTKLQRKGCDILVANDVSEKTGVMGGDRNTVHLVSAQGVESWPEMSKTEVAKKLAERAVQLLAQQGG